MRKGKYAKRGMAGKTLVLVLALVMLIGGTVGGTLAWLTDTTNDVVNTFTESDINITLVETDTTTADDGKTEEKSFKMIPGWTIEKDPVATVLAGSEDCYLFVEVKETGVSFTKEGEAAPTTYAFGDFLTYEIAAGWTKLEDGVYYKIFDSKSTDANKPVMGTPYAILKDNQVKVKETVTKQMMDDLDTYGVNPKLTFTAYAVQLYKGNEEQFSAADAWAKAAAMKGA